eukprot:tig00000270_g23914.t1
MQRRAQLLRYKYETYEGELYLVPFTKPSRPSSREIRTPLEEEEGANFTLLQGLADGPRCLIPTGVDRTYWRNTKAPLQALDPADDATSEASDAESDINDFIDFDVPIPYDSESSSDSEGDNENPTRKRRIIKTKSIVKKKFMETTSFTDNSERVKNPAKEHEKDLKIGAGIARSRVTSHYTERLTQHVKTIEKRIIAKREMAELRRKLRHERLLRREMTLAKIAERKKKEAAELRARVEAQQRREAEAAAALAAQREQERQDLVQAAQALPRIPLSPRPMHRLTWFPMMTLI